MWLTRLVRQGHVERVSRGLYEITDADWSAHHAFAEVAKLAPNGVICLLSALNFHELTTQIPFEVWLGIDRKARPPQGLTFAVRLTRFSGAALTEGVEEHWSTACRCASRRPRARSSTAFATATRSASTSLSKRCATATACDLATVDDLSRCAGRLRAANVIRPYLESLQ